MRGVGWPAIQGINTDRYKYCEMLLCSDGWMGEWVDGGKGIGIRWHNRGDV